jgi:predicted nucleic acid-binding protein
MKFVSDANILFSLAKPLTTASQLVSLHKLKLFSPSFAFGELSKHRQEIELKTGLSFKEVSTSLKQRILFINEKEFSSQFNKFKEFIDSKDVPYLALASSMGIPVWSNDHHLKQQSIVEVFTTEDLIEALEE